MENNKKVRNIHLPENAEERSRPGKIIVTDDKNSNNGNKKKK